MPLCPDNFINYDRANFYIIFNWSHILPLFSLLSIGSRSHLGDYVKIQLWTEQGTWGTEAGRRVISPYSEMDLNHGSINLVGVECLLSLEYCYTSAPEVPVLGSLPFSHVWHILCMRRRIHAKTVMTYIPKLASYNFQKSSLCKSY